MNHLLERIFQSKVTNFDDLCLEVFKFQFQQNTVYQQYCRLLNVIDPNAVASVKEIPFLPVGFFKTQEIRAFRGNPQKTFFSSATGGSGQSKHGVFDLGIYEKSFLLGFENYFGPIQDICFLGLLPSYLEREGSSLIYMIQHLMQYSGHPLSGFFLYEHETLLERIVQLEKQQKPYFIFGVSFALLDFCRKYPIPIQYGKIIETGGMKGRKKEMTKQELYHEFQQGFQTDKLYSEYGMTELLSQAYSGIDGYYQTPAWMKAEVVDANDPMQLLGSNQSGLLRIIDLANLYSCSFIQSSDLGRLAPDGQFEVLGRADNSDLRGCSLMVV